MMHKIANAYANWLTTPFGQSQLPPIMYIFIFCPLAVFAALAYCGPYYADYWHGTPIDGIVYGIDKHGRAFSTPIRPWITTGAWILAVAVPPFLSAAAFQLGWLGREVRGGNGENSERADDFS
jgi:hypothetical protein